MTSIIDTTGKIISSILEHNLELALGSGELVVLLAFIIIAGYMKFKAKLIVKSLFVIWLVMAFIFIKQMTG